MMERLARQARLRFERRRRLHRSACALLAEAVGSWFSPTQLGDDGVDQRRTDRQSGQSGADGLARAIESACARARACAPRRPASIVVDARSRPSSEASAPSASRTELDVPQRETRRIRQQDGCDDQVLRRCARCRSSTAGSEVKAAPAASSSQQRHQAGRLDAAANCPAPAPRSAGGARPIFLQVDAGGIHVGRGADRGSTSSSSSRIVGPPTSRRRSRAAAVGLRLLFVDQLHGRGHKRPVGAAVVDRIGCRGKASSALARIEHQHVLSPPRASR